MILAVVLMILKGSGPGHQNLFSNLIKKYVEETAASLADISVSRNQAADFGSLSVIQDLGSGGPDGSIELSTVQDNSFISLNPSSTDYLELGIKSNQVAEYTVQTGDALSFIASDFGVSISSIIWANNLTNADSIRPDQVLRIPPVSGVIHKVKSGDTVSSLAKKYGVGEDKIVTFNRLSNDGFLSVGEEVIVPDGKIAASAGFVTGRAQVQRFSYLPDLGDYFFIPATGYNWGRIHGRNGVDIANSCGTPIKAAADGSVAIADGSGYNGGFGRFIKLLHGNGTETLYAHASKLLVSAGQYVQKGQQIALMGSTGRSTGCHLHFEVHGAKNPLLK